MNYIAYTVGPIYDTIFRTLQERHKTKRLKAGSYFFSYFMQRLLGAVIDDFDILVPYADKDVIDRHHKVGYFHDRFIAQSTMPTEEMRSIFEMRLAETYARIAEEIGEGCKASTLEANMDNHLLIATDEELRRVDENVVFAIDKVLDAMELQRRFDMEAPRNCIVAYQDRRVIESGSVRTLEKIAGGMQYYAVITADADRLGERIRREATEDPSKIRDLSKSLYRFFTEEREGEETSLYALTHEVFGGELIYAGGDDVLAFMPVKTETGTFFDYIEALDARLKHFVGKDVSFSFGVEIIYYKYPLRMAIDGAFRLLHRAKESGKSMLALQVTKHSGQQMRTVMPMLSEHYRDYSVMLQGLLDEKTTALPHAFHHSLSRYRSALIHLFAETNGASLSAFFNTVFNDEKSEAVEAGMAKMEAYISSRAPATEQAFDDLLSELAIIKFLREDRA